MTIFRWFRRLVEGIEKIAGSLLAVANALDANLELQREIGPGLDRLEKLELSRAQFEAEMGALVLKAEGKFKAANNAEARERQLKKSYERLVDDFDPDGAEPEATAGGPVLVNNAEPGEEERLHAMRLGVAPNNKASAIAAKWGR